MFGKTKKVLSVTKSIFIRATLLAQNNHPNIIYIFTDQQTATAMSCTGNKDIKTPNIDRLAAKR